MSIESFFLSPTEAIKRLRPGSIKVVRVLFQSRGGEVSLLRSPKIHVRYMLQQLPSSARVTLEVQTLGATSIATVVGALNPIRAGELSDAAAVARRLT
jgi:hypothetical protein